MSEASPMTSPVTLLLSCESRTLASHRFTRQHHFRSFLKLFSGSFSEPAVRFQNHLGSCCDQRGSHIKPSRRRFVNRKATLFQKSFPTRYFDLRLSNFTATCVAVTKVQWRRSGSNRQPPACKAGALPIELRPRGQNRGSETYQLPFRS